MKAFFKIAVSALIALNIISCGNRSKEPHEYEVWGLDISRHQSAVDWARVFEHENPHFVFLKATEGTLIQDPMFESHRKELAARGALWGAYHFFGHRTSGREQALNFIGTSKLEKGNLIPVLDIEPHRFFKDPQKLVAEVNAFCKEIKSHYGVYPIMYSSTNFYNTYLRKDFPASRYVIWIADYNGAAPSMAWDFWQHTDSHSIQGARGKVDRNVFAGSPDKLKKLVLK